MQRQLYFTPGPAQLYPTFEEHLKTALHEQVGSISHRSKKFKAIYQHTAEQLKELFSLPNDVAVLFTGSATEIWERVLQNCVAEESFHLVNGAFSKRFYEFATELGKRAAKQEAAFGEGFDVHAVTIPAMAELVCLTHNETSSGVSMPVADMHRLKQQHPDKLFVVDMVSSAPYPALDFSLIDSAFFSVQKAFGMPAGLGVWLVNEKCLKKSEMLKQQGFVIGTHHSLPSLWSKYQSYETPATPNVLFIYLLGKIAGDMNRKGLSVIRRETDEKAKGLYEFLQESQRYEIFVKKPAHRSATVIVANVADGSTDLIQGLSTAGFVIGSGYGSYKEKHIRIANFPAVNIDEVQQLIEKMRSPITA